MLAILGPIMNQMMFLFLCIVIGFILKRTKTLPDNAHTVLSKCVSDVFTPALTIKTFYTYCTPRNLAENANLMLYCVAIIAFGVLLATFLAPRFAQKPEDIGIYKYSITFVNYGFMGNALVQGVFGDEMLFRYLMFCIPASVFIYSVGIVWLTGGKKKVTLKSFVNPAFVSMLLGIVLGMTQIPLPKFVMNCLSSCAGCFSVCAMILTGFVVGSYDFGKLIRMKQIYVLTLLRVILMPLFFFGVLTLLRVPQETKTIIMVFCSMPLGLNTIVFPAAYGQDTTPGASMALISNVVGILTVPLILSLVF